MDREAWWATVHGVAKSQTRLSDLITYWLFNHRRLHFLKFPQVVGNPMEPWGATVHGVAKSQTRVSNNKKECVSATASPHP